MLGEPAFCALHPGTSEGRTHLPSAPFFLHLPSGRLAIIVSCIHHTVYSVLMVVRILGWFARVLFAPVENSALSSEQDPSRWSCIIGWCLEFPLPCAIQYCGRCRIYASSEPLSSSSCSCVCIIARSSLSCIAAACATGSIALSMGCNNILRVGGRINQRYAFQFGFLVFTSFVAIFHASHRGGSRGAGRTRSKDCEARKQLHSWQPRQEQNTSKDPQNQIELCTKTSEKNEAAETETAAAAAMKTS